jgi:hypothetical protein
MESDIQSQQGLTLEVVLPFQQRSQPQSGVNLLMSEDSIQDVSGYAIARENPVAKTLEAQKLLGVQKKVGFSFAQNDEIPIDRMIDMEVRDRINFSKGQESSRPQ